MARILTCTDGSEYAHSVYHYSAWAAKRLEAEVHVLHMLDPLHEDPLNADSSKGHLGSNLERVIRSCKHPVLVASMTIWPMRRFVFAYDSGPSANKAVDYLVSQPLLKGLECHLLCVGKSGSKHERSLQEAESKLVEAGYKVEAELRSGDADEVIAEAINKEGSDLLVMGAFGHSRIRQLIVGSTTTAMIRGTKRPVLLFR